MRIHMWIGLFALLMAALAGSAVGRILGLPAGKSAYLSLFVMALIVWLVGRRARLEQRR